MLKHALSSKMPAHQCGATGAAEPIAALAGGSLSTAEAIRRAPELLRARAAELAPRWGSLSSPREGRL
jgi:hypothetical protein